MTRSRSRKDRKDEPEPMTTSELDDVISDILARSDAIVHVLDDLNRIQANEGCREVALAITKLEEADMWLERKVELLEEEIEDNGNGKD